MTKHVDLNTTALSQTPSSLMPSGSVWGLPVLFADDPRKVKATSVGVGNAMTSKRTDTGSAWKVTSPTSSSPRGEPVLQTCRMRFVTANKWKGKGYMTHTTASWKPHRHLQLLENLRSRHGSKVNKLAHTHICSHKYTRTGVSTHTHTCSHKYTHMLTQVHTQWCQHTHMLTQVHTHWCQQTHTCSHKYALTDISTHMLTQALMSADTHMLTQVHTHWCQHTHVAVLRWSYAVKGTLKSKN